MKFSIRQSARAKGQGYWISPENHIYRLPDGESHAQWIQKHQDIAMHSDPSLKKNDPNLFEKAFYKGWVRVRIEFDSSEEIRWIASVSALDKDILGTLPEDIKDIILQASVLEFIEMPSGNIETFDKESMQSVLHRRRYGSFKKIKYAILNPSWKRYPYAEDLKIWDKLLKGFEDLKYIPEDFFDIYKKEISHLYDRYVRTKSGGSVDPNRAIRQKFVILNKGTMDELQRAVIADEERNAKEWNENQLREESLDAKLEREKGEYEAKNASLGMSFRDKEKTN